MTPTPLMLARRPATVAEPGPPAVSHSPMPTAQWLLTLDEDRFAKKVSLDVRGKGRPDVHEALRDPKVLDRWAATLRVTLDRLEEDFSNDRFRAAPRHLEWRKKARTFERYVLAALDEAERLLAEGGESR